MKNKLMILSGLLAITSGLSALNEVDAKKQGNAILQALVNGHTRAFGQNAILKGSLDLSSWNPAISQMKAFATTIINENKNLIGMRDSTLVSALEKISKAEMDLVNSIKVTRAVLNSKNDLNKQIAILTQIKNNMIAVQSSLKSPSSSPIKKEAQQILNSSAMFIETTAAKAIREANAA